MLLEEYIDVLKQICRARVPTKFILKIPAFVCYIFLLNCMRLLYFLAQIHFPACVSTRTEFQKSANL